MQCCKFSIVVTIPNAAFLGNGLLFQYFPILEQRALGGCWSYPHVCVVEFVLEMCVKIIGWRINETKSHDVLKVFRRFAR
jgi:hypothetical protein